MIIIIMAVTLLHVVTNFNHVIMILITCVDHALLKHTTVCVCVCVCACAMCVSTFICLMACVCCSLVLMHCVLETVK